MTESKGYHVRATVHPRALENAKDLFPGTLSACMVEMAQNARRAGATQFHVFLTENSASKGVDVRVVDNGRGVSNWNKLLELGGSHWDDQVEKAEHPAGMGLFALGNRTVRITSGKHSMLVTPAVWTGREGTLVTAADEEVRGTSISFTWPGPLSARDQPEQMKKALAYLPMAVTLNEQPVPPVDFMALPENDPCAVVVTHSELGVRIIVHGRRPDCWDEAYHSRPSDADYAGGMLNFYGHVVKLPLYVKYSFSVSRYYVLVEMTGGPTALRLMLPARTQVIENEAFAELRKLALMEIFRYVERRQLAGHGHDLSYASWRTARNEFNVVLPDADWRKFVHSNITSDDDFDLPTVQPTATLAQCITACSPRVLAGMALAGKTDLPVSVRIDGLAQDDHGEYSWVNQIRRVQDCCISVTGPLSQHDLNGSVIVARTVNMEIQLSDGSAVSGETLFVPEDCSYSVDEQMSDEDEKLFRSEPTVMSVRTLITLNSSTVFRLLRAFNEDSGEDYDTQLSSFDKEWDSIRAELVEQGSEWHRAQLFSAVLDPASSLYASLRDEPSDATSPDVMSYWKRVTQFWESEWVVRLEKGGRVTLTVDGKEHVVEAVSVDELLQELVKKP